jgi:UPF0755 protein
MDNNDQLRYMPEQETPFPESGEAPADVTDDGLAPMPQLPQVGRSVVLWTLGVLFLLFLLGLAQYAVSAPGAFPKDSIVTVEKGQTLIGIADSLSTASAIRSRFVFRSLATLFGGSRGLKAGDYYLESPQTSLRLAWRLTHARYELKEVRVTIPEGSNTAEIAEILKKEKKLTHFDAMEFVRLASPHEGYLFPDTYQLLPNVTAQDVLGILLSNFDRRLAEVAPEMAAFNRSREDVIKMASIVEEEARTDETRRTIAGILWKRLDIGMPLQVDAAFAFVNGKRKSSELTLEDLAIDSPYNTYTHKGLPPTPISNPGLDSIRAAVQPVATKYFFYLSDDDGNMHYAVTNAEHEANKARYLR